MRGWSASGIVVVMLIASTPSARGQGCSEDPAYATLDFWVQLIERSMDGGATWQTGFDAVYRRRDPEKGG